MPHPALNWSIRGTCCACEKRRHLRTVIFLSRKAPTPGQGWGCIACGLPFDGAIALVCDRCVFELVSLADPLTGIRLVCSGRADEPGRVPFAELKDGEHKHDLSKHPEIPRVCRICGCTDEEACTDANGDPCHWVEPDLCSECAAVSFVQGADV